MEKLQNKKCSACEGDSKPLSKVTAERLNTELIGWTISSDGKSIEKEIVFKNFDKAMDFVNLVADIAEIENHHPDIAIHYNKVNLVLSTHAIGGLSENDFIVAAKIDRIDI